MKIKFIDNLTFNIYITNSNLNKINIKNKEEIESYLHYIFNIIKDRYNIFIEGFYNAFVYIDKNFGVIFNLNKEKLDYYDYFNGQVDLNITIKEVEFLYKIDDIPNYLLKKIEMTQIKDDMYYKIIKKLNNKEDMYLIEHIEKIYV